MGTLVCRLWRAAKTVRDTFWMITDPKRIEEHYGERVVLKRLQARKFIPPHMCGMHILEIGPNHCKDTMWLDGLHPHTLSVIDLPSRESDISVAIENHSFNSDTFHMMFFDIVKCSDDYLDDVAKNLPKFDMILCAGVIYHVDEQLRLLRRLHDLAAPGCRIILESATIRNKRLPIKESIVEVIPPGSYRGMKTITHMPSREALKHMLLAAGFTEVTIHHKIYSRHIRDQRTVLTAIKG